MVVCCAVHHQPGRGDCHTCELGAARLLGGLCRQPLQQQRVAEGQRDAIKVDFHQPSEQWELTSLYLEVGCMVTARLRGQWNLSPFHEKVPLVS